MRTTCLLAICLAFSPDLRAAGFETARVKVAIPGAEAPFWTLQSKTGPAALDILPPVFSIDGARHRAVLVDVREIAAPVPLANGTVEYRYEGRFRDDPSLSLELRFRAAGDNPVVRFAYKLKSSRPRRLTKPSGSDDLTYLSASLKLFPRATEVRLSEFLERIHSYTLQEYPLAPWEFDNELAPMGPVLAASDGRRSVLIAYEHGSQVPDAFLRFRLAPDRMVHLAAVKANYLTGQSLGPGRDYETIWFDAAAVEGDETALRAAFRDFVLRRLALHHESRKPYIYYNTWNFQERNKHWNGKPYLESMNEERMLAEIDVAHRMGIDVFVLDTGWYEKTGDWRVSSARFPRGLGPIKSKLDGYGMKLGLWFDPTAAARSSAAFRDHPGDVMSWRGRRSDPKPIWETEPSFRMCLVSGHADVFADELIRAYRELGVTYFKWDAVAQYGCDSPDHGHGGAAVTAEERAQSYAFQLPRQMARIAEKLAAACPQAIVDFDVTESGRAFGLGFLSAGKYFLVNNGPYYQNYDVPIDPDKDNWNLFFHKGPARTWIARAPLDYDNWIPSSLFLTHYLPDDPYESQIVNIASLILGQNGIWGDLPRVSSDGVELFGHWLGLYKQVRDDITASSPVTSGPVSGASEVHEKIATGSGRGAIVLFSTAAGPFTYVSAGRPNQAFTATQGVSVKFDAAGRAVLRAAFDKPGAAIVFFGAK
jgi:alpha-galactosidase